ncbi:hypothetical protein [Bradyrhizobium sp. dw_78]|uniref:hypothetical protein n=1 Tax=Bradyrhizobium sp. dw_78 TaxID=2719793 RepID=UPI001BD32F37|nr:hypothetical protein [Bradyrhizobium sp. dw_78]
MIERHLTADRLNEIVNDPSVYPWVRGACDAPLDLAPLLSDKRHVCLLGEFGGCVFVQHQPGLYEVHTQMLPGGRGQWALDTVNECLRWMFTRTDAVEIWTRCPRGNLAARALARAISGQHEMDLQRGWVKDGEVIPAAIFSLTLQQWMKTAPGLEEVGHWFHMRLADEYRAVGFSEDIHADDASHDRYVGAAVEMLRSGQPEKGVIFYNRWAVMAGYEPIKLLGTAPVMVDIKDAVLAIGRNDFFVASVARPTA